MSIDSTSEALSAESGTQPGTEPDTRATDVLDTVLARIFAALDLTASTFRLAVAESRLAASSAGLFVACTILLAVSALVTWMVLLATVFAALQSAGISALGSLGLLLLFQILLCAGLAWMLARLGRTMSFPLTRQALGRPSGGRSSGGLSSDDQSSQRQSRGLRPSQ